MKKPLLKAGRNCWAISRVRETGHHRLCHQRIIKNIVSDWVAGWMPHDLIIDPKRAIPAERLHAFLARQKGSLLDKGDQLLSTWF